MKPNNFRGGKFFFVLGMQLFLALRLATADQNDGLDSLSDSELYLHPNQEIARPLLESRMDRYTPAERANFKDELLLEIERRKKGSLPATASELLDRLRDGQIDANAAGISISLQALLEESSDSERNQIRDRFISDWELLTLPDASDRSPESERKRFLFEVCVFRRLRPPIPIEGGHSFRGKAAIFRSAATRVVQLSMSSYRIALRESSFVPFSFAWTLP
jgi:hypothetical protein